MIKQKLNSEYLKLDQSLPYLLWYSSAPLANSKSLSLYLKKILNKFPLETNLGNRRSSRRKGANKQKKNIMVSLLHNHNSNIHRVQHCCSRYNVDNPIENLSSYDRTQSRFFREFFLSSSEGQRAVRACDKKNGEKI